VNQYGNMRFGVLTAARLTMLFFGMWRVDKEVDTNVSEEHTLNFLAWRRRQYVFPKRWFLPTSLQGTKTQKNNIVNNIAKTVDRIPVL
jgi:hypothetical protein